MKDREWLKMKLNQGSLEARSATASTSLTRFLTRFPATSARNTLSSTATSTQSSTVTTTITTMMTIMAMTITTITMTTTGVTTPTRVEVLILVAPSAIFSPDSLGHLTRVISGTQLPARHPALLPSHRTRPPPNPGGKGHGAALSPPQNKKNSCDIYLPTSVLLARV